MNTVCITVCHHAHENIITARNRFTRKGASNMCNPSVELRWPVRAGLGVMVYVICCKRTVYQYLVVSVEQERRSATCEL